MRKLTLEEQLLVSGGGRKCGSGKGGNGGGKGGKGGKGGGKRGGKGGKGGKGGGGRCNPKPRRCW